MTIAKLLLAETRAKIASVVPLSQWKIVLGLFSISFLLSLAIVELQPYQKLDISVIGPALGRFRLIKRRMDWYSNHNESSSPENVLNNIKRVGRQGEAYPSSLEATRLPVKKNSNHFLVNDSADLIQNVLKVPNLEKLRLLTNCERTMGEPSAYSPDEFVEMLQTEGCENYLKRRAYRLQPLSIEEQQHPLAFNFKVYRNFEQFERLFRMIYQPQNFYCIHVDRKSSLNYFQAVQLLIKCNPLSKNVALSSQRASVFWGEYSTVLAELYCFEELLKKFPNAWSSLINLTGEELPLHSNLEMVRMSKALNGRNWIGFFRMHTFYKRLRIKKKVEFRDNVGRGRRVHENNPPPPLKGLTLCKGDVAGVFSHGFVNYLINSDNAKEMFNWCKNTWIADETCIQSLHCSAALKAPGGYKISEIGNKLWQNFPREKWLQRFRTSQPCRTKFTRQICIFGVRDTSDLLTYSINRRHYFKPFANKFFLERSRAAFRCVEIFHEALTANPQLAWTEKQIELNVLSDKRISQCRTENEV